MRVSRRALILCAVAAGLAGVLPARRSHAEPAIEERHLVAKPATVNLTGDGYPDTAVWAYDGSVPGPEQLLSAQSIRPLNSRRTA